MESYRQAQPPGVIDYALNLVDFDPKFAPAFWYVFRDTLVVETLSDARRLMGRYRMVTLDGDLVEKSGAMTGGHYRSRMKFAAEESKKLLRSPRRSPWLRTSEAPGWTSWIEIEEQISTSSREVEELNKAHLQEDLPDRGDPVGSGPGLRRQSRRRESGWRRWKESLRSFKERLDPLEKEIRRTGEALAEEQQKIEQA